MTRSAPDLSLLDMAQAALDKAKACGADAADAVIFGSESTNAGWRVGALEDVERSESQDLGLRVFVGRSSASVSSTDFDMDSLDQVAERAVAMARVAPADPHGGLAESTQLCPELTDLDLYDPSTLSADDLAALAREAEEAALEVDGVTNSLGASASFGTSEIALATSDGFAGTYRGSSFSVSCSVIAGQGTAMERDYDYSHVLHLEDLDAAGDIGRRAAKRAVDRLNPRKIASQSVPVVYDRRVSAGLVSHLASAANGSSVARGTSFLRDCMGERLFAEGIRIVDDPHRRRGLRSKPCDAEGVRNAAFDLVDDGVLKAWLLDSRTSRQLGIANNGRASRGIGSPPSPSATNLYMEAGGITFDDLIGDIASGLYVTDLIGMGVNPVNGDYSRGASGFWIENGELAYPVSEITIAGNLREMFASLVPADDLEFRYGTNAPTLRVEGMTVAGT